MKKQEFIPKEKRTAPFYTLQSAEQIGISQEYAVRTGSASWPVYSNPYFSFCIIVTDESLRDVDVEIEKKSEFTDVCVRPREADIPMKQISGQTVSISLRIGERAVLEYDRNLNSAVYILTEHRIKKPENATICFERGQVCDIGKKELHSGDIVYIEDGAIVSGVFYSRMADDITITGNGILYGGNWHLPEENGAENAIETILGQRIRIEGITVLDYGSWHIVPVACRDVTIQDVNVLGNTITGDGIDLVGCENIEIDHCFVRANDDCISIKGEAYQDPSGCADCRNIRVHDCLFWNAEFGNALEIGYETQCDEIRDIRFEDCTILHCEYEGNQSGGCLTIHDADRAHIHDVFYRNIEIEDAQEKFIDLKVLDSKYSHDRTRGRVDHIYYDNIRITGGRFPVSILRGYEMAHELSRPDQIFFRNIQVLSQKIEDACELRMVVELCDEVKFV